MSPLKKSNILGLWENQQLGFSSTNDQRALIDYRIRTLRDSRKHVIVPWKNRPVGATALNFDEAEQRFLLCGSCVGDVSIVDMDSPVPSELTVPLKHTVYRSPVSQRHRYMISGCQFYPVDSGMFVTASMDQEVRVWDSETMRVIDKYKNETAILDCHWGMPDASGIIAIALGSSCVRLIDPRTRNHIQHMRWKNKFAKCLRWMTGTSHFLLAGSESGNMVLWDIRSGKQEVMEIMSNLPSTSTNERRPKASKAHSCSISSIRCSKNGRNVVSMSDDRKIHIWDGNSMELERTIHVNTEGQCTSMAELGDEGNDLYGFVGIDKNLVITRLTPQLNKSAKGTSNNEADAPSSKKRKLRSHNQSSNESDTLPSSDQRVIRAHFQPVMSTAYRRTHQQIITSSGDGSTLIWSPEMDEILPKEKEDEIKALYRDDFSDED